MHKYRTVKMLAEELNLHPDTIYRMCERREITHYRIRGQIRFNPEHIRILKKTICIPARKGGNS